MMALIAKGDRLFAIKAKVCLGYKTQNTSSGAKRHYLYFGF
jgi:hypothetical protein